MPSKSMVKSSDRNSERVMVFVDGSNLYHVLGQNCSRHNVHFDKLAKKLYETEASGGVNLKNVRKIARTGVKRISIGALTHNINSLDFKLEI